jgi:archaellum biogenesis ATPase FlaH
MTHRFSSGVPSLDRRLGGGYLPGVVEVYGSRGSGKTTLARRALAAAEKAGASVSYWTPGVTKKPPKGLLVEHHTERDVEEVLKGILEVLKQRKRTLVVLDPLSNLVSLDTDLVSGVRLFVIHALPRLCRALVRTQSVLIVTSPDNQRHRALHFYATTCLRIREDASRKSRSITVTKHVEIECGAGSVNRQASVRRRQAYGRSLEGFRVGFGPSSK